MKRLIPQIFIALFAVVLFTSCEDDEDNDGVFRGSPVLVTESRDLPSFHSVVASTSLEIEITAGQTQSVEITSNENLIDRVNTTVNAGVLTIEMEPGSYEFLSLEVQLVIPELILMENHGAGAIRINGFEETEELTIRNSGAASFSVTGSGQSLEVDLSGSGDVNAFDFAANDVIINLSGAGNIEVSAAENLSGFLSGAGNISYKGTPTVDINISGAGRVVNAN